MAGESYGFRAKALWPIGWWLVLSASIFAVALKTVISGPELPTTWLVPLVGWWWLAAVRPFEVTVNDDILLFRSPLRRRRRRLADLRAVERRSGMVLFTFDHRIERVDTWFNDDSARELVDNLERVKPELVDPLSPSFAIVLRGYERTEVDRYFRLLRERRAAGAPTPGAPSFSIAVRGYDRKQVRHRLAQVEAT